MISDGVIIASIGAAATIIVGSLSALVLIQSNRLKSQELRITQAENEAKTQAMQLTALADDAESRRKARTEERTADLAARAQEQDQVRKNRESDQQLTQFFREQVDRFAEDVRLLRLDNGTMIHQISDITRKNDLLDRDLEISERDRKAFADKFEHSEAQNSQLGKDLARITAELARANQTIKDTNLELKTSLDKHDAELKHVNTIADLNYSNLQKQMDDLKRDHAAQVTEWQRNEVPRNREIAQLRFSLREAVKLMSSPQLEALTMALLDRAISLDKLMYLTVDPLLFPTFGTADAALEDSLTQNAVKDAELNAANAKIDEQESELKSMSGLTAGTAQDHALEHNVEQDG